MRADHQKLYAALVLQLLLDGNPELCKTVSLTGNEFVHLLKQNLVLLRVAKRLESMGLKPSGLFADAVEEERQRIQAEFALIHKLSQLCLDRGIEHIFAKAFKHYPDMGHDIDLFVLSRSTRVDAQLIKALNASPRKPNLCNRIAGTVNYRVPACESLLEIHHGRLGNLGEHRSFLGTLIKNGKRVEIEGLQFQVPSPEDQLILQVLQRVYGCRYLRLSDIAHAISSIRRDALDWDYILENATLLGTFDGLCCYLSYVDQVHLGVFDSSVMPLDLRKALILDGWGQIEFKGGYYRFPGIWVANRLYAKKFRAAIFSGNWHRASKLSLLPLATAATLFRRLANRRTNVTITAVAGQT